MEYFRKKFKTRSGDNVKLKELLDEGVRRAKEKLRSKGKEEVNVKWRNRIRIAHFSFWF